MLCSRVEWTGAERSESGLGRPELVRAVKGGYDAPLRMGTRFHYLPLDIMLWSFSGCFVHVSMGKR